MRAFPKPTKEIMNTTISKTVRAGLAALVLATLSSASFALDVYETRGVRLHTVKAGESVTVRCASCGSKINAEVKSVGGSPKTATAKNGRITIGYICPSCATR
jgi:DNA-directed RNA polymerase subunit RPC12/RpoP